MEQTKITEMRNRRISAHSKGYQQRLGIAQALLGNPRVIILDEPTVGLDPIQIIEIRDLIRELGQTHTVIFSSHILSEVQTICDQIVMINHGKLIAFGEPGQLEKQLLAPSEITVTAECSEELARDILADVEDITEIDLNNTVSGAVTARIKTDCADIYRVSRGIFLAFAGREKVLLELTPKRANLEDVFLELTEDTGGSEGTRAAQAPECLMESEANEA